VRCVQSHGHEKARDQTRARQCNDPGREDEENLLPVDSAYVEVAQSNTNSSSGKTLSCAHRKAETTGKQHGDGSAELHGEATCGRDLGDLVTKRAHDVEAINCRMISVAQY